MRNQKGSPGVFDGLSPAEIVFGKKSGSGFLGYRKSRGSSPSSRVESVCSKDAITKPPRVRKNVVRTFE